MLFSEMHVTMVNKITFIGFRGAIAPIAPPRIRLCVVNRMIDTRWSAHYESLKPLHLGIDGMVSALEQGFLTWGL